MSEKEQKQWYVVRAIGGKEKKVKEYIENEVRQSHPVSYTHLAAGYRRRNDERLRTQSNKQ